ncbi:MAG TPA: galactokinase family protein [Pyrinomonadaceae bacterium]|nr:galactokinase family protein [Pyrinomonadaceae bacterium]
MYRDASDVQSFLDLLNTLDDHPFAPVRQLFNTKAELIITRAPGRLDLMGGIADYSGSHVLEFPIAEAMFVALQLNDDRRLNAITLFDEPHHSSFTMSLSDFDAPVEYERAREFFQHDSGWAAYVAGVFLVLMRERNQRFESGANILISSRVPPGKGVSSSAALEVAVMQAVTVAFNIKIDGRDKALLCQRVENLVVGAPCGVMDQMTAVFGERDRLLLLLCQPAELKSMITLPPQLMLWGIDSGIRHSVSGSDYGTVRAGAFMGTRIIADLKPDFSEGGYLANISPDEFEREYVDQVPERMSGAEFLRRFKTESDSVTAIDPQKEYAVRKPTAHPIYENARVQRFVELLERNEGFSELGELMYEAHQSYTALRLNSAGTDLIVELVRKEAGLFGAKITGGGSGGTVAVLGDDVSRAAVERVVDSYAKETGHHPYVFSGSSPGCLAFGHLRFSFAR